MSNPDIPRGGEPPDEVIKKIKKDLEQRGMKTKAIRPSNPEETVKGNHEQQYHAEVIISNSDDGVAIYEAHKRAGQWSISYINTRRL